MIILQKRKTVNGVDIVNSYGYANDKLDTITHNGVTYGFDYDVFGNNTKVSVGNQTLMDNQYENSTGNLTKSTYGNGKIVENVYDSQDRVIGTKYDGVEKFTYTYDANGNIAYSYDKIKNIKFLYEDDYHYRQRSILFWG